MLTNLTYLKINCWCQSFFHLILLNTYFVEMLIETILEKILLVVFDLLSFLYKIFLKVAYTSGPFFEKKYEAEPHISFTNK